MHMFTACLYLVGFGLPMLGRSLLLVVAHTGEMTKLVATFALVFLHWTLEPLYVY